MKAFALLLAGGLWLASALSAPPAVGADGPDRIEHVVIIFMENRGFDHLYGRFPGANGLTGAGPTAQQVDRDGVPYTHLPPVTTGSGRPPPVDTRFPTDLPNAPFLIDPYVPQTQIVPSPTHLFYQQQEQINGAGWTGSPSSPRLAAW
jgi:phospholipase C